jgi:hypothetical protein
MKFDITSFQDVAANLPVGGETCDLAHTKGSTQTETDAEIASLIQQVGATSIAEIDRLIAELQEVKHHLQSEGERVERQMVRYILSLLRWLRSRPRSSLTPSPNGIPRPTNKKQRLPKSRRLRRTTITTASGTPPNSVRRRMPLRGRNTFCSVRSDGDTLAIAAVTSHLDHTGPRGARRDQDPTYGGTGTSMTPYLQWPGV